MTLMVPRPLDRTSGEPGVDHGPGRKELFRACLER